MKIAAGCVALLVAAILLGGAFMDWRDDNNDAAERSQLEFSALNRRDYGAIDRALEESHARTNSEEIRAGAGAAFLIAGLFIFGTRKKAASKSS